MVSAGIERNIEVLALDWAIQFLLQSVHIETETWHQL